MKLIADREGRGATVIFLRSAAGPALAISVKAYNQKQSFRRVL